MRRTYDVKLVGEQERAGGPVAWSLEVSGGAGGRTESVELPADVEPAAALAELIAEAAGAGGLEAAS